MQNSISLADKKTKNLNFLPTEPGIYKFLNSEKGVIYIGKAKNLRKRVKSYFSKSKAQSRKLKRLTSESYLCEDPNRLLPYVPSKNRKTKEVMPKPIPSK